MTSKWLPPVDLRHGGNGQVACELVSPKCELVSESGSEHFQEEEFYRETNRSPRACEPVSAGAQTTSLEKVFDRRRLRGANAGVGTEFESP